MKRRATTGGKVGKARRRSVKRRHKDRRISTLTNLEKRLREERREHAETRRQLSEALEQQTATSEVLKVISSSQGELEAVFKAILENATSICEAGVWKLLDVRGRRLSPRSPARRAGEIRRISRRRSRHPAWINSRSPPGGHDQTGGPDGRRWQRSSGPIFRLPDLQERGRSSRFR